MAENLQGLVNVHERINHFIKRIDRKVCLLSSVVCYIYKFLILNRNILFIDRVWFAAKQISMILVVDADFRKCMFLKVAPPTLFDPSLRINFFRVVFQAPLVQFLQTNYQNNKICFFFAPF